MTRNINALTQLRAKLVAEKRHHDQATWAKVKLKMPKGVRRMEVDCATTACAAGHACLLAGDAFIISEDELEWDDNGKPFYHPSHVRTETGEDVDLEDRARQLLGLTHDEAYQLFYGYNSRKETIKLLDQLIAGESIVDVDDDYEY